MNFKMGCSQYTGVLLARVTFPLHDEHIESMMVSQQAHKSGLRDHRIHDRLITFSNITRSGSWNGISFAS